MFEIPNHAPDVSNPAARLENLQALLIRTHLQEFNCDSPTTPVRHFPTRRHIEIDSIRSNEGRTVIINYIQAIRAHDAKLCSNWKPRPIRCCAIEFSGGQSAINSVALSVSPMCPFRVAIRGCFYLDEFIWFASLSRAILELASVLGAANHKN